MSQYTAPLRDACITSAHKAHKNTIQSYLQYVTLAFSNLLDAWLPTHSRPSCTAGTASVRVHDGDGKVDRLVARPMEVSVGLSVGSISRKGSLDPLTHLVGPVDTPSWSDPLTHLVVAPAGEDVVALARRCEGPQRGRGHVVL